MKKFFDTTAVILFGAMLFTGIALTRIAPDWTIRLHGAPIDITGQVFGVANPTWVLLHRIASFLTLAALVPNMIFEWSVLGAFFRREKGAGSGVRFLAGLFALVTLLIVGIEKPPTVEPAPVQEPAAQSEAMQAKSMDMMSLADVEKNMRVPQDYMRKRLKIPADASSTMPLSALMARYRFTFNDVQQAVFDFYNRPARPVQGR